VERLPKKKGQQGEWVKILNHGCYFEIKKSKKVRKISSEEIVEFACADNGATPLAGARYVRRPYTKGKCEKGDPEYEYVCMNGCSEKSIAPKRLYQDHWEC
jgi:hypothetical protein